MLIDFTDAQMRAITVAAKSLRPSQRGEFLKIVSRQVRSEIDVGGAIQRALYLEVTWSKYESATAPPPPDEAA